MNNKSLRRYFVGLFLFCLIPVMAGVHRLWLLKTGNSYSENIRFLNAPWPIVAHIISMFIYAPLGGVQLIYSLKRQKNFFHKQVGYIILVCGLLSALSGLEMTRSYPRVGYDGIAVYIMRWVVGFGMIISLFMSIIKIKNKQYSLHGHWMLRAYAIGMGAGTQVLTHLPIMIFPSLQSELSRAIAMGGGWFINILLSERIISKCSE